MRSEKYSGNNLLAMLVIIFIVFSIWSTWITSMWIDSTGKVASDSAYLGLCYQKDKSIFVIDYPIENEIISGNYTIRGRGYTDPESLIKVRYTLSGNRNYPLGSVTEGVENYFNYFLNTKNFQDLNCGYRVYGYANFSTCTPNSNYQTPYFTINNVNTMPVWTDYRNNLTTNFSNLSRFSSWIALYNVTVGVKNRGKIEFGNNPVNFDSTDLNYFMDFTQNRFYIGSIPCVSPELANYRPNVTFFNVTFLRPRVYRNGAKCALSLCEKLDSENGTYKFRLKIAGAGTYALVENAGLILTTSNPTLGFVAYYVGNTVRFLANLTDDIKKEPVHDDGTYCLIHFRLNYEADRYYRMEYNSSSDLYYYKRTFIHPNFPGNKNDRWEVWCNASSLDLGTAGWVPSTYKITNRAPVLTDTLPNETMPYNTRLVGRDLDLYFKDPDNDPLNYSVVGGVVQNIEVLINKTTHIVTFIPESNWYGNRTVSFLARDTFNASAMSNLVYIEVVKTPETPEKPPTPTQNVPIYNCKPNWICGNWSACKPAGIKTRDCEDLNYCNVSMYAPEMAMNCTYVPNCFDHIMNGAETGVDCGGSCPLCPTCSDGIRNQGEKGIDCGGPCYPCPSCFDGIFNQGEEQIDCGGPCNACPTCIDGEKNGDEEGVDCGGSKCKPCEKGFSLEKPGVSKAFWSIFLISLTLAVAFSILIRKKIAAIFATILSLLSRLKRITPHTSLYDGEIGPFVEIMDGLDRAASLLDIKDVIENFFALFFGDLPDERLPIVISYTDYLSSQTSSNLTKLHNMLFQKTGTEPYNIMRDSSKEAVREAFIEAFLASGIALMGLFESMLATYSEMKKEGSYLASVLREELYQVYLRLPLEDKGKVYKRLREIDTQKEGGNA